MKMAKITKQYDGVDVLVIGITAFCIFSASVVAGLITYQWAGFTTYWLSNFYAGFGGFFLGLVWLEKGGVKDWKHSDAYAWTALLFLFASWLCILVTTPKTQPERYCSHQIEIVDVYDGARFNVFSGKIEDDFDSKIRSLSERCEEDPLDFMRANSQVHPILFDTAPILAAVLALPMLFFIFSSSANKPKSGSRSKVRTKTKRRKLVLSADKALPKNSWFLDLEENDSLMEVDNSRIELTVEGEPFLTVVANVVDIITRMHLCKGDYQKWFVKMGNMYLDKADKETVNLSKDAVKRALVWAQEGIPMLYGTTEAGKKRYATLQSLIDSIENC